MAQLGRPAAQGSLSDRPVARLLHQIFRKKITGVVAVSDESGDVSRIYVRDGYPVHVLRPNELDRLDQVLVDCGILTAEVVATASAEAARAGRRLGEVLADRGILSANALAEVLKAQLRRKLTRLFVVRLGTYEIFVEPHAYGDGHEFAAMRVDPRCLVYPGLRVAYDDARLVQELTPLLGQRFRLVDLPPEYLPALGFAPHDPVIEALRQRALMLDDLPTLVGRPAETRAVVLALLYTDLLDASEGERIVASPPTAAPKVPPGDAGLRAAVTAMAARLDDLSLFELLDVPETASPEDVSVAFVKAARRFHPDRLAAAGLPDLILEAQKVMARLTDASSTLGDPKLRAAYVAMRAGRTVDPGPSLAQVVLAAEQSFRRGELLMKKGDFARAAQAFEEASRAQPDEPQYRAYLAWTRFEVPGADKRVLAPLTLDVLGQAVREQPKFALGHFFIGQVCKQTGNTAGAASAFRAALASDPGQLDAERELRLIEIRRAKGPGKAEAHPPPAQQPAKGGLLGKLFKRDS